MVGADPRTLSRQLTAWFCCEPGSWIVTPTDVGGNFNVLLPGQVYAAGTSTAGMAWSGLTPGKRYMGAVQFLDLSGVAQATTVLSVSP